MIMSFVMQDPVGSPCLSYKIHQCSARDHNRSCFLQKYLSAEILLAILTYASYRKNNMQCIQQSSTHQIDQL